MKLKKDDGIVCYSPSEMKVFALLSKKRKSTAELVKAYYKGQKAVNGRQILVIVLRSLKRKIAANKEPYRLVSSKRNGPHPIEFWLEAK